MKNKIKNDEEKVNETKSNISQNESHQPLNSDFQNNINFRLLNQNKNNLYQKGDQQQRQNKNSSAKQSNNSIPRSIPSNKEYKEDEKNHSSSFSKQSKENSSFQSSLISDKKVVNLPKRSPVQFSLKKRKIIQKFQKIQKKSQKFLLKFQILNQVKFQNQIVPI